MKTSKEYKTVIKISKDIMWTSPLTVAIIAYLDWLSKPTIEKNIFESKISIKWYKIIESIESNKNILGPHIKFKENNNWVENSNDKNIGASVVVGRGIKNISLVSILNKSAKIWNAPFLPIKVGPILLWVKASNFLSVRTTKRVNNTTKREDKSANSYKFKKILNIY